MLENIQQMTEQQTHSQQSRGHNGHGKSPNLETMNDLGSYQQMLLTFLDRGYQPVSFPEYSQPKGQLILRHDIDFDTHFALQCAQVESELGVRATYFFLMRSNFYNLLSKQDFENINQIKALGHTISIHFDPTIYEEQFHQGLKFEVQLFELYFNTRVEIISLHRPTTFFLNYDYPIDNIEHTYQSKYFKDIQYISDSTGEWRYGHPLDSDAFANQQTIHLLTHPIWWMQEGISNQDKLKTYFYKRKDFLKNDFYHNCKPFQEISEHL